MFCKHNWEILQVNNFPSPSDNAAKMGANKITGFNPDTFFGTKIQTILTCKKCGELRNFVETNP